MSPRRAFHAGLTRETVVATAVELTRESSLWQWSMRDLARRLDVAPSVLYHHVGGQELLARYVVEAALADLPVPDPALDWRDWFRQALAQIRPPLEAHPGVAKWLMLHGPTFPAAAAHLDAGVAVLERGGFGDRVALAFSVLLNGVVGTIALADERLEHATDGPRDHAAIVAAARDLAETSPGVAALRSGIMEHFVRDLAAGRDLYHRVLVDTLIAGLETQLAAGWS